ncbi:N-lysine methyltransferase KMT5A [Photinus pyralis]|nr:N-lysine methyltransferase KMT5A [Photinus pyralis]
MVKGRRVKALVANTCTTGVRNCYPTRRKVKNGGVVKDLDNCITSYFNKIVDSDDDFKDDCKISSGYDAKEALLMVVEESILNSTSRASTPHRIQLNSDEDKKFVKGNLIRSNLNGKLAVESIDNHKLTEYFPIRRSERKTKRTVLEEKRKNLEQLLRDGIEEGLKVTYFEGKGRGVVAAKPFSRGDFVVEYSGELLDVTAAKIREAKYAEDETTGCYMYYFKYLNQQYCIDATAESGRLGRLVNHSRNGNLITRTVSVDGYPHLILLAKDDIAVGEEISYDYGDRSRESLKNHPWLAF